jgi:hypothetical protein
VEQHDEDEEAMLLHLQTFMNSHFQFIIMELATSQVLL